MRILIVQSWLGRPESPVYPLGLAAIGSVLVGLPQVDVRALDLNVCEEPMSVLKTVVQEYEADLIGFSMRNIDTTQLRDLYYYYLDFQRQIRLVRSLAPHTPIMVGGAGFSLYAEKIMERNPEIDVGVYREGEATVVELVESFPRLQGIRGTYCRNEHGVVVYGGDRPAIDPQTLPPVKWDIFDLEPYRNVPGAIGIETKRGCLLKCEYCTYPFLDGVNLRLYPLELITANIRSLVESHGITQFTFVDSVFNVPRRHAVSICEAIKSMDQPVTWIGWFNEKHFDEEFAALCSGAGCVEFSFSPDGYSDRSLKSLGKNIHRRDIDRVFSMATGNEALRVSYNFIANPPGQDMLTFLKLVLFMFRSKFTLAHRLKGFCLTNIRIEPETGIYQRAIRERLIDSQTELLPDNVMGLKSLFYRNPGTPLVELLMRGYVWAWRVREKYKMVKGKFQR